MGKYGRFSEDFREYVVTRPDTIRPWCNHFGNERYGVMFSQCGSGDAVAGDDFHVQMNYYLQRYDQSGRYVYVHDCSDGDYWAVGWQPVRAEVEDFQCRQGRGYGIVSSRRNGIEGRLRVFVPVDEAVELWTITIRNTRREKVSLKVFPFFEWVLDAARVHADDLVYAAISECRYDEGTNAIVASTRRKDGYLKAFMAVNAEVEGYDCRRADFVGAGRTLVDPIAVERGRCSSRDAYCEIPVGVFCVPVELDAGESTSFDVMVAPLHGEGDLTGLKERFFREGGVEEAFRRLEGFWEDLHGRFHVVLPDRELAGFFNHWVFKHVYVMAVTPTIRRFNKGFRNVLQDAMGVLPVSPERARKIILEASKAIHKDGQPLGGWSVCDLPDRPSMQTDLKFWFVKAVCNYVRETGDLSILQERTPFVDDARGASVLDKVKVIVERGWKERGEHGLSLIGAGDWNDNLDRMGVGGKGESVWLTESFAYALRELALLYEATGDGDSAGECRRMYERLKEAVNTHAWDGDWYIMGYTDDGDVVGSSRSSQVHIFSIVQAWVVVSGIAPRERVERMRDALKRMVLTEYGYALMDEAYTRYDPAIGSLSRIGIGMNENASVYSHVEAFLVYAFAEAGYGNDAYDAFLRLLPFKHDPDVTQAIDFALPNFYRGPGYPEKFGCIHRSWTTSTPNWLVKAMGEALMGVKPLYDGFVVSPSIPSQWRECRFVRAMRGSLYRFVVENPDGVESGVKDILVDGKTVTPDVVPYAEPGSEVEVRVVMGRTN